MPESRRYSSSVRIVFKERLAAATSGILKIFASLWTVLSVGVRQMSNQREK